MIDPWGFPTMRNVHLCKNAPSGQAFEANYITVVSASTSDLIIHSD